MDYCLYGDRCSVAKISNDYGGVLRLKVILENILRNTKSVFALFKRPNYWEVEETHGLIASLVSSTENLKVADDFFSISFEYITGANNDEFIHVFSRLWYQFEQPTGYFFTSILNGESFNSILETKTLSLSEKHISLRSGSGLSN